MEFLQAVGPTQATIIISVLAGIAVLAVILVILLRRQAKKK